MSFADQSLLKSTSLYLTSSGTTKTLGVALKAWYGFNYVNINNYCNATWSGRSVTINDCWYSSTCTSGSVSGKSTIITRVGTNNAYATSRCSGYVYTTTANPITGSTATRQDPFKFDENLDPANSSTAYYKCYY